MDTAAVSEAIIDVASRVILPRFRTLGADEIEQKQPGDLVTIADKEAEIELAAIFARHHPAALIIGEESVFDNPIQLQALPDAEHAWVIDPVDGTNNYARGSADFGVMVAETRRGEAVRSWIWQPAHQCLFVAEKGAGVRRNDEPVPAMGERPRPLRAAVPRSLRPDDVPGFVLDRTRGSCAIDYPKLLLGEEDVLAYRKLNEWDHLPGALMVSELGGRVATHEGERYRAGVRGVVMFAAFSGQAWADADAALVTPGWLAEHAARRRKLASRRKLRD